MNDSIRHENLLPIANEPMSKWNKFSWIKTPVELMLGAVITLILYLGIMNLVVSKSLLFSIDARRIVEVYKFCTSLKTSAHNPANFVIGSSIAVEGIDAGLLDQSLNDNTVTYNLGVVGLTPVEALILEPAFKVGKPQVVVIGIDAMSFGLDKAEKNNKQNIDFEKLQAYRATNSIASMDAQVKRELLENILLSDERAVIESDYFTYLLNCRSLPIFFTESKFRELLRKGLRTQGIATDFKSPWMLKSDLSNEAKERIIGSTQAMAQRLSFDENSRNVKAIRALSRALRAENIAVLLTVWPVHPRISNTLSSDLISKTDATLIEIARENHCAYKKYSDLLSESDFADALHPNMQGRSKLSTKLATDIKLIRANSNGV